jgi:hypothetical protein
MTFLFFPKLAKNCPDVGHCPHLGGAALGSVVLSDKAKGTFYFSNRGRPRGRRLDSRPKRRAVKLCHNRPPYGVPRAMHFRSDSSSAAVCGRSTHRSQFPS